MRRAVGIVRVSETKGREGDGFASPGEQADRIRQECGRHGLKLLDTYEEMDVSGGLSLDRRPGLRRAVGNIERGQADVIVAAYFDRLFRSLDTQREVLDRVEAAGGQVLAVDIGRVSNGSAAQWLNGTIIGAMSEYQRRSVRERTVAAQKRAVARGVVPWPNIPPGYRRRGDGVLEPDPVTAPIVAEAFAMRAAGATVAAVRAHLRENGIERTYHGTSSLLRSRMVLGEIRFGDEINLAGHEAIVEHDVWARVQRQVVPRGPKPKSDRLLARLGVLRCGTCGSKMVVATSNDSGYWVYRCPPTGDCSRRVAISAEIVERQVRDAVLGVVARFREVAGDIKGAAPVGQAARQARTTRDRAQANLAAALRAFSGFENEEAARDKLIELGRIRDEAQARVDQLGDAPLNADDVDWAVLNEPDGWERLTLDARRKLIRAFIERVSIAPGRGPDRVAISVTVEIYEETQDGS